MPSTRQRLASFAQQTRQRLIARSAGQRLQRRALEQACERIIEQANPALRGLGGYRRRLLPVVEGLLAYTQELLDQIPGPIPVDTAIWAEDAQVNALFGSVERIRQVLSGPAVQAWLEAHPFADGEYLYGLLVATPGERTQLGMELVDDQVRQDVRQTALSFSDHELYTVGADMDELRETLGGQVLDLMASIAVADLVGREERIAALEQAVRMLRLRLRVVGPRASGLGHLVEAGGPTLDELARLKASLAEAEQDLAAASQGLGNIEQYLQRLIELLGHPRQDMGLEPMVCWLDRMNIVRAAGSPDANEVRFMRSRRPDRPGRVVQYIRFPRDLILSEQERRAAIDLHLGL